MFNTANANFIQVLNKIGYCMLDFPYIQLFHSNDRHHCTDLVLSVYHTFLEGATSKEYIGQGGQLNSSIVAALLEEIFTYEKTETATKAADYAMMLDYARARSHINVATPGSK